MKQKDRETNFSIDADIIFREKKHKKKIIWGVCFSEEC
jgi:hypothetical protein